MRLGLLAVLCCASAWAGAMDLKQALERARQSDPAFQAAQQELAGLAEVVPQAQAALLPNASLSASRNRVWLDRDDGGVASSSNYFSQSSALVLRQPLWRAPQWVQLQQARTQAGTQDSVRRRAEADLLVRVASAYFDLLYATQTVEYIEAVATASQEQLRAARRSFELGRGTRTDIDDAQARFDLAGAQGVQARQNRVLAERQVALLLGLGQGQAVRVALLPLQVTQAPSAGASLAHWQAQAQAHNPDLQLARARFALAQLEVDKVHAGHHPTVDLVGQRSISKSENTQFPSSGYFSTQVGVQINVPLYSGGATESAVRQALANRERERFLLEQVMNDLTIKVQREHNALAEGADRLQAARQSLASAEQLVISTGRGMMAGTRTIVDRLNAVQRRAEARRELALVLYQLHLARLKLSALASPDGQEAVEEVNRLLVEAP